MNIIFIVEAKMWHTWSKCPKTKTKNATTITTTVNNNNNSDNNKKATTLKIVTIIIYITAILLISERIAPRQKVYIYYNFIEEKKPRQAKTRQSECEWVKCKKWCCEPTAKTKNQCIALQSKAKDRLLLLEGDRDKTHRHMYMLTK